MNASRSVTGAANNSAAASRVGPGNLGLPVVDMIEVSVRTRSGKTMASSCAIMPPIDAPTMWAERMFNASSRPTTSVAMSRSL